MPQELAAPPSTPLPYRIEERHLQARRKSWRPLLLLVILGIPLLSALLGLLGGGTPRTATASTTAVKLTMETPRVLRSGNWFETQMIVDTTVDVADLTIAIDQALWRRMSVDTLVPDAKEAKSVDSRFVYSFGPVARGERFVFKLDGQIQPYGLRRLEGRVTVRDGERPLASLPVTVLVLP